MPDSKKHGVPVSEVKDLVKHVISECTKLKFKGLMSIGNIGDLDEFREIVGLRDEIIQDHQLDLNDFELSLGTSKDYEDAILVGGSTEIRVGTDIFGKRAYPPKKDV